MNGVLLLSRLSVGASPGFWGYVHHMSITGGIPVLNTHVDLVGEGLVLGTKNYSRDTRITDSELFLHPDPTNNNQVSSDRAYSGEKRFEYLL